ncbi:hypothetical protein [Streptomyces sp. AVP053U2]|uniref:hypothetical protein n=1 Tax=Streptomyces sp. AVP053U2 TaxID=1737066 RepID=UPI00073C5CD1|nr:hypothetical protein [Streptomyces sp. AVP053U2]ODA69245.1 hypothetical protein APS67_006591 [Streptomyces sp. AVP053U2]
MNAATSAEWLTAAAIGLGALPLFAAAVYAAHLDLHLPHMPWDKAKAATIRASARTRLHLARLLMLAAWHLEFTEATR